MSPISKKNIQTHAADQGFTLVEILIVVFILAILAAIIVPQCSNATEIARASSLAENLRSMRTQLVLFHAQHNSIAPGYPDGDLDETPTADLFQDHLTQGTTASCDVGLPGSGAYPYGPYFRDIPVNPMNNLSTVQIIGNDDELPVEGDDSHGYIYQPDTLTLLADNPGTDEDGKLFYSY